MFDCVVQVQVVLLGSLLGNLATRADAVKVEVSRVPASSSDSSRF